MSQFISHEIYIVSYEKYEWKYDKMNEIISVLYKKKSHTLIYIQQNDSKSRKECS